MVLRLKDTGRYEKRHRAARRVLWSGLLVPCLILATLFGVKLIHSPDTSGEVLGARYGNTPSYKYKKTNKTNAPGATDSSANGGSETADSPSSMPVPGQNAPIVSAAELATTVPDWQQDFTSMSNGSIDRSIWDFETGGGGWGNSQAQYYTDSSQNARIEGGRLVIEARHEAFKSYNYTSARIVSRSSFTPQYGTIVFGKVRMPTGVGTWPALWMWPSANKYTPQQLGGNGQADLANGELDVMEYVGAAPGEINASAHAYLNYPGHGVRAGQVIVPDVETAEHDYSIHWNQTTVEFAVDGKLYYVLQR